MQENSKDTETHIRTRLDEAVAAQEELCRYNERQWVEMMSWKLPGGLGAIVRNARYAAQASYSMLVLVKLLREEAQLREQAIIQLYETKQKKETHNG